jgi:argininosuccinate lyase
LKEKRLPTDKQIEHFTVEDDRRTGFSFVEYDALGSIAHAKMLKNWFYNHDRNSVMSSLNEIIGDVVAGNFNRRFA